MTRGELIRERRLVKAEEYKRQMRKGIEEFSENKVDYIWTVSIFVAVILFIGAVGTADLSETIPESAILIGALSLLHICIYGIIKSKEE